MPNLISSKNAIHNENALYYFKKTIIVHHVQKSIVKIFADARYKLYVNNTLVAVGPCKQSSETKYYDVVDISEYIRVGENEILLSVLQLTNSPYDYQEMFIESVIRSGDMVCCLWGNVGDVSVETDESWLVAKENGIRFFFEKTYDAYAVTALCEHINPHYRNGLQFEPAIKLREIYSYDEEQGTCSEIAIPLEKRKIPMMYFSSKPFVSCENNVYDAGKLTCGYLRLRCKGKGKAILTYAECRVFIEKDGSIRKRKRDDKQGVILGDFDIVEVDGNCFFEPFWMKTFRYVQLELQGDIEIEEIDYIETGYPIQVPDEYDFGDEKDNKLFDISVNTLKRCMHETYVDCPYYEQLQYTMDTHLQVLFTYQLTMDKALPEKAIDDFAKSYRVGGLTQSRYPTNKAQYILGFSMFYIMMLYEHEQRFADKEFVKKYLPIADGIIDWFVKRLDGYMVSRSNLWDFVDWAEGYDFGQIPTREPVAVYSLMLAYVLKKTSYMHKILGNEMPNYDALAERIMSDVKERCFDEEKGLYADGPSKTHFAQHPQIWAVLCGMEKGESAKTLLLKSMDLTCKASSAWMFHYFRALEMADMYDLADKELETFRGLLDLGCTTTPEWIGEDVRSECHAWSAVAIYEFTAKVLGVTYRENAIYIQPYIGNRTNAKGYVATPKGMVYCAWSMKDDEFIIELKLPENSSAKLTMPNYTEITATSGVYKC